MKPVEIEILLKDRLTSGLLKSDAEIKKFLASVRDAFSSTEGRSEKLYDSLKKTEELINEYSAALSKAMEDRRKYYKDGDTEAYEKESAKLRVLADDLEVLRSIKSKVFQAWDDESKKLDENKKKLDEVDESTQNLSNSTKELSDSGEKYSSTLVKMLGGQQSYNAILSALPPEVRQVITGIEGMTKASLAFIATPLGMVLAALAATIALLNTYWHGTIEGEREFAEISGYTEGVVKSLKDECIDMGKKLSDMFKTPLKSVKEYWKTVYTDFKEGFSSLGGSAKAFAKILSSAMKGDIDGVKDAFDEMAKGLEKGFTKIVKRGTSIGQVANMLAEGEKMVKQWDKKAQRDAQIAADQRSIEEEKIDRLYREAEIERELAKLRNEMYSGDANAKIKAQAKAQELVNEQYGKQIELAERAEEVARRNYNNHKSNLEDKRAYEQARAEVERLKTAKEQAMLPFNRRAASAANTLAKQAAQDAKETAKAEGNLAFMDAKQQAQNERAARQLALQTQQAYIDGMDEGHEKVMAQLKLQREQELLAIEQQKDNALMAKIAQAKQKFDADKSNQGKVFDMSSVAFSEEELAQWDALIKAVETKLDKLGRDAMQGEADAMRQYLENYGTYQEQKLAIAEEYADKIKKAQTEGERLSLAMQRDSKLEKLDREQAEVQIDWKGIFSDLKGHTKDYLEGLRDQLEELLSSGTVTDIEQMATIQNKITDINNAITEQGHSWSDVGSRMREHKRLIQEATNAQERLNEAKRQEGLKEAEKNIIEGSIRLLLPNEKKNAPITKDLLKDFDPAGDEFKRMKSLLESLTLSEGKLEKARKKVKDATEKAAQAQDAANISTADLVTGWFSDMQEKFKKFGINEIPDLLNTLGFEDFGEKASQGLSAFNNAAGAAADFASGNYVGAALKGINAVNDIAGMFGIGGEADKNYAKDMERLSASNEHLIAAIDRLSDRMETGGFLTIENSYEEQKDYLSQVEENISEQLERSLHDWKKANFWGKGHVDSAETVLNENLTSEDWGKIIASLGYDPRRPNETGLAYLTANDWAKIRDGEGNGFLWDKILEFSSKGFQDASKYIEEYVSLVDKENALEENRITNLTGISFDGMRENFRSTLLDMEDDAKDTSEYISKVMAESLLNDMLSENYDEELAAWRVSLGEALKMEDKKARAERLSELKDDYQDLMNRAKADADDIYKATGYDTTSSTTQSGKAGAFTTMSQEQGTKLEGLFVSGQMHWSSMDDKMTDVSEQMGAAGETLRKIEANTSSSAASAAGILEELKKMIRDGLKVK